MKTELIVALVAVVIALGAWFAPDEARFGGTTNYDALTLDNGDLTLTNGIVVSNAAPFCEEFYATSTATRNRAIASTTATIEGVDGVITFGYGACP